MNWDKSKLTSRLLELSLEKGFDACGTARAEFLESDAPRLERWLKKGYHGKMSYMENHFDKRLDPRRLVEGTKSVVVFVQNYFPEKRLPEDVPQIAKYAYGEDYHLVIKDKLYAILNELQNINPEIEGRAFTDSTPILEKSWAVKSGLGWIGKNGNLLLKGKGSFYLIGILLLNIELNYFSEISDDYCGTCTRCIDACPTEAILPDKEILANQCISYFTIELKEAFDQHTPSWSDWVFGCDICQDVCPWNRFSLFHNEQRLNGDMNKLNRVKEEWARLDGSHFNQVFKNSPLKRTGYKRFLRNVEHISSFKGNPG